MDKFILHSEYKPTGDQPHAIKQLVKGGKREISVKHFLELQAQVRVLRWQTLFNS